MPAPLIYTLTIPRSQIVAVGRQITRLYRSSNAAEWRGHAPGALVCSRIEGAPERKAGTMVYTLELSAISDQPSASRLPPADWSVFDQAIEQPDAVPYAPDPVLPVVSHTPQPARGE